MPSRFGLGSMTNASARLEALLRVIARLCSMAVIGFGHHGDWMRGWTAQATGVASQFVVATGEVVHPGEPEAGHPSAPTWDSADTGGFDCVVVGVGGVGVRFPFHRWLPSGCSGVNVRTSCCDVNVRTNAACACERTPPI